MNHWDPRAEALLTQARAVARVPAGAQARVKSAVMASVALSTVAGASAVAPTAVAKLPAAFKAGSAIASSALAAAGKGGVLLYLAPVTVGLALGLSAITPSAVSSKRVEPVALHSPASRALRERRPAMAPTSTPAARPATSVAAPLASVAHTPTRPAQSLSEEANLLERARLVLRQGDAELTLRLLDRHRREFPEGALFYEALAMRATALCQRGRFAEGQEILKRLEQMSQGSAMLTELRRGCEVKSEDVP